MTLFSDQTDRKGNVGGTIRSDVKLNKRGQLKLTMPPAGGFVVVR